MVLSKQNKITSAMRNEIYYLTDKISQNKSSLYSPLPIAQLAVTAKLIGYQTTYEKLLPMVFNTSYKYKDDWLGNYGSVIRDEALILSLLIENNMAQNTQANYLVRLSNLLNDKNYFSTQELNSLFIAGWSIEQHKGDNKFDVSINGEITEVDSVLSRSYDYAGLAQGLSLHNSESKAPLYIKFTVNGYSKTPPAPTSTDGFFNISRTYYDLQGNSISPETLDVGSMMVVVLDVSAQQSVRDALIVDFLPAGLELENQNLSNSSVNLSSIPGIAHLMKGQDISDIIYQEYRDDRYVAAVNLKNYMGRNKYYTRIVYLVRAVTTGNYMIPYPYVESMYRPERFAIGNAPDLMTISNPKKEEN